MVIGAGSDLGRRLTLFPDDSSLTVQVLRRLCQRNPAPFWGTVLNVAL